MTTLDAFVENGEALQEVPESTPLFASLPPSFTGLATAPNVQRHDFHRTLVRTLMDSIYPVAMK